MDPAVVAALGAVGGAFVGATAGGLVDWVIAAKQESQRAATGARLLRHDLLAASYTLLRLQETKQLYYWDAIPLPSWERYQDALAAHLTQDERWWVNGAVAELDSYDSRLRMMRETSRVTSDNPAPLDGRAVVAMKVRQATAIKAYNALARLAEDDEVQPEVAFTAVERQLGRDAGALDGLLDMRPPSRRR